MICRFASHGHGATRFRLPRCLTSALLLAFLVSGVVRGEERAYRTRVEPHWNAAGTQFWYRNDLAGGAKEYVVVDAEKGTRTVVPSEPREWDRAPDTNATTRMRSTSHNGPETVIVFTNATTAPVHLLWIASSGRPQTYAVLQPGRTYEQHTYAGHVWQAVDERKQVLGTFEAREEDTVAVVRNPTKSAETQAPAERRPASKRAAVRDFNVWLDGRQLTTDGTERDGYEGGVRMAPDGAHFVAMRRTAGDDRQITIVESSPKDQVQPRVKTIPYAKPGDTIAQSFPHLFDTQTGREIPIPGNLFSNPWSNDRLEWAPDGRSFSFVHNQRGHQVLRVIGVDAQTGAARAIVDETSRTFIDYAHKQHLTRLQKTGELIWMSERDGWNHLYLYDATTGRVKNPITRGEWVVRSVDRVDEEKRQIWFRAGGIRPGQDPYYLHFCRVNFDGSGLVVLTEGDGTHALDFSPDRRWFIDRWSRVDLAPVSELRRSSDGSLVCLLERGDDSALRASGWHPPERFVAKAADGATDLYGIIHWPRPMQRGRQYPVLEDIYAGPQDSFVPKAFGLRYGAQELANRGFIVVQVDAPGTSNRSKKFHDVCWKNVADAGLVDRIAWIKAAAAKFPVMDLSRVGIYGGSAGGQSALRAVLMHPDFYKAAAADCGCHDNRMDKIWWNELWMGWPVGPEYAEQSNVTQAYRLQGKLLLMVGELDDNVDPASTMQVVDALIKADKDFEFLIQPGQSHGSGETPYGRRRRAEFFERSLR